MHNFFVKPGLSLIEERNGVATYQVLKECARYLADLENLRVLHPQDTQSITFQFEQIALGPSIDTGRITVMRSQHRGLINPYGELIRILLTHPEVREQILTPDFLSMQLYLGQNGMRQISMEMVPPLPQPAVIFKA